MRVHRAGLASPRCKREAVVLLWSKRASRLAAAKCRLSRPSISGETTVRSRCEFPARRRRRRRQHIISNVFHGEGHVFHLNSFQIVVPVLCSTVA
jgi:hypothetical protein